MANVKNQNKRKSNGLKDFFKSFSMKQFVWFVIGVILFVIGLVFDVLNIVGGSLNIPPSKNPLLIGDSYLKSLFGNKPFGFLFWGIVLVLVGAIIIAITSSLASKNEDRDKERQARREQRLKRMLDAQNEAIEASTVQVVPTKNDIEAKK